MLTDGHCHPTDTPNSLSDISSMELRMALMSTRFDDLDLVAEQATRHPNKVIPAFGIHPWYSHLLTGENYTNKVDHYQSVLDPTPNADDPILKLLPEPTSLDKHMNQIEELLNTYPIALLGEVGLDKAFKIKLNSKITPFKVKLEHQRLVLRRQLQIAANLGRSVSLHGVQAPQALFDEVAFVAGSKKASGLGLRSVCLHSYGGSADFYTNHWLKRLDIDVFVSIAVLINGQMQQNKLNSILNGTNLDLVLSESDYHSAGEVQVDLVKQSVELFAKHFNLDLDEMEKQLEQNFDRFVLPK